MSDTSKNKDSKPFPKSVAPLKGSTNVHSEKDDSSKDGFKPNKPKK